MAYRTGRIEGVARRPRRCRGTQTRSHRTICRGVDVERFCHAGCAFEPSGIVHRPPLQPSMEHAEPHISRRNALARISGQRRHAIHVCHVRPHVSHRFHVAQRRQLRGRMEEPRRGTERSRTTFPRRTIRRDGHKGGDGKIQRPRRGTATVAMRQGQLAGAQVSPAVAMLYV